MRWQGLAGLMLASFGCMAQGAVSLAGTRLVFDGRFDEAAIEVSNRSDAPVLIQAWLEAPGREASAAPGLDSGVGSQATGSALPFVLTPPLARLVGRGKQTLRLLYQGVGVPLDRETLLHLYVLEVPRRSEAAQQLNIAIRQRINVFYRPKGLPGDPADAAQQLTWQWPSPGDASVTVRNPTPFHVALQNLKVDGIQITDYQLLPPFSTRSLPLANMTSTSLASGSAQGRLSFQGLTDYGGQRDYCSAFQGMEPFTVPLRAADSYSLIGKC